MATSSGTVPCHPLVGVVEPDRPVDVLQVGQEFRSEEHGASLPDSTLHDVALDLVPVQVEDRLIEPILALEARDRLALDELVESHEALVAFDVDSWFHRSSLVIKCSHFAPGTAIILCP